MREGFKSPKYGHRGVYFLSTGPDPNGPRPGDRVKVVIYGADDQVIRRFEQVQGECLDPGYVDFFNSPKCRPAKYRMPLVDFAPDGTQTTLLADFPAGAPMSAFQDVFRAWVERHAAP